MYIRALASISPQQTFAAQFPAEPVAYTSNRLTAIEPDYKAWIDAKMIRRMSRIIKMGVTAASLCLKNAGLQSPDAIVTGTAYGCLEDTGIFLNRMIEFNEEMLNPTAFIQSTHNTVGAQIALSVKCYGYNNTFVHRGFSFENALLDAILLLKDNEASNVLVGSADEITNISFGILSRFGIYRDGEVSSLDITDKPGNGTVAGEGAAFFLLAREGSPDDIAVLGGIHTFYKPAALAETESEIKSFLAAQSLSVNDIDLVITGKNGDAANDELYAALEQSVFAGVGVIPYKHLCGEYPTSSSFALWYAASILKSGAMSSFTESGTRGNTDAAKLITPSRAARRILIYNNYKNIHHSLFLVSAC
jgi:3-oxoacyl-[acyl-carrier-protein] synthase II